MALFVSYQVSSLLVLMCLDLSWAFQNSYCSLGCDYGYRTVSHTVCDRGNERCGPHPNCGPDFKMIKLTDHQRQYIVDLHNYLRNIVALGNETRGRQPPASNMALLSYNKELEFIAQCWANMCQGHPLIHDTCRRTSEFEHVGQNLANVDSSDPIVDILPKIRNLIMLWYDEVALFNSSWVLDTQDRGPNVKVGHYTQMLWAETTEIGCAVVSYTKTTGPLHQKYVALLVCNYGPGGNYLGLPVYSIGNPASDCPENMKPNSHYTGLCGTPKTFSRPKKVNLDFFK